MNKIKETIKSLHNDGSDPRRNDVWRILLFALNNSAGASLGQLICRWNYYTQNVLQLGVFLTSINVFMVLIDAFTDPVVANIFDTFESKHGKFRPFMFTGCMMTILPAIVIFCYPVNSPLPHWATFAILITMNVLIVLGNTVLSTATRAGQAIITQDPKQRPVYSLGQTVFDAVVSGFVTIVVTSNLVGNMQETKVWRISVLVLSVISIVLVFIAMKAIKNRDNPTYYSMSKSDEKPKMSEFIYFIKRSKPFRCLFAATVSDNIASSIRYTLSIYLFANIIMNRSLSASFEIISGALLGAPAILIGVYFASKKGSAVVYTKVSVVQTII